MNITLLRDRVRDDRFGAEPTSPAEALRQARALLAEEGRWLQGYAFKSCDPNESGRGTYADVVDPDAPLCGSWGVCAIGSVALVTGDMALVLHEMHGDGSIPPMPRLVMRDALPYDITDEVDPDLRMSKVFNDSKDLLDEIAATKPYPVPDGEPNLGYKFAGIIDLNDSDTTRQDVLDAFDEAIERAEALSDRELVDA